MTKRKRTIFPKEFKLEAVRLVLEKGMTAAQVARDLGLNPEPKELFRVVAGKVMRSRTKNQRCWEVEKSPYSSTLSFIIGRKVVSPGMCRSGFWISISRSMVVPDRSQPPINIGPIEKTS